jgi:acyl carrier protein
MNDMSLSPAAAMAATMREVFARVWAVERPGEGPPPALDPDTVLLETGLDSLGFAIFVAELEDVVGYDPFAIAQQIEAYPQTFGEFMAFYAQNRPPGWPPG